MQSASAVSAELAIPTIPIARDPAVNALRDDVNAGNEQHPRDELPAGERQTDPRPGVRARVDAASRVHGLHEAHRFFEIDLRKTRSNTDVMQVERLDEAARIHSANARDAPAAEIAAAIVQYR